MIGISIAAIPGPIFFELIRRTLKSGIGDGVTLVIGEFVANCVLLSLIFFGVSHFLTNHTAETILYVIGGCILIAVSLGAWKLSEADVETSYEEVRFSKASFITGFGISASSPIVIALWLSLSGSYLNNFDTRLIAFINIVLIAFGFLVFFIPLAWGVHKIRHKIPPRRVVLLSRIFGLVLVGFGILLLRRAFLD